MAEAAQGDSFSNVIASLIEALDHPFSITSSIQSYETVANLKKKEDPEKIMRLLQSVSLIGPNGENFLQPPGIGIKLGVLDVNREGFDQQQQQSSDDIQDLDWNELFGFDPNVTNVGSEVNNQNQQEQGQGQGQVTSAGGNNPVQAFQGFGVGGGTFDPQWLFGSSPYTSIW
jgi:hypothetical protein